MQQDKWIDLHLHSTYSDGLHTPTELVGFAKQRNLAAISLTDHDCLDGFPELAGTAEKNGIEFLSGTELSCVYRGKDLHVLGYGVDVQNIPFQSMLTRFRDTREKRGLKIAERLAEQNVHIDTKALLKNAGQGALGRPHIAEALVRGGYVRDIPEAFDKYIGENCPAYVEKFKLGPGDAVDYIQAAGGLAFVAHGGYYMEDMDAFLGLIDEGFDGIEIYHPKHSQSTVKLLSGIAEERRLLTSGGSDFHGFTERDDIGSPKVPYGIYEEIKKRLKTISK